VTTQLVMCSSSVESTHGAIECWQNRLFAQNLASMFAQCHSSRPSGRGCIGRARAGQRIGKAGVPRSGSEERLNHDVTTSR
jgi:hypothetical protein